MKKFKAEKTFAKNLELHAKYGDGTGKLFFPHDKLMQALYWIWDAFDRSAMGMFLVYGTAQSCMKNTDMIGDRITVGVRKNEWFSGSKPILMAFTGEPIELGVNYVVFKNPFNTVPVYVYIYSEDESIVSTGQILYENEYFKVPNTYERFVKVFGENP